MISCLGSSGCIWLSLNFCSNAAIFNLVFCTFSNLDTYSFSYFLLSFLRSIFGSGSHSSCFAFFFGLDCSCFLYRARNSFSYFLLSFLRSIFGSGSHSSCFAFFFGLDCSCFLYRARNSFSYFLLSFLRSIFGSSSIYKLDFDLISFDFGCL